jgi:hypothetical protein
MEWSKIDPSFVVLIITNIVLVVGAYFGLKGDNATLKVQVKADINEMGSKLSLALLTEQNKWNNEHLSLKEQVMSAINKAENLIFDLTHRVSTLENGQDEWTKALRDRSHTLANDMQRLTLKIDRLERPKRHTQSNKPEKDDDDESGEPET